MLVMLKRVPVTIKCMATAGTLKEGYDIGSKVHLYMMDGSIMIFGFGQE